MTWWTIPSDYEGIIADGSIRAGKTLSMSIGFVSWAYENFTDTNFAICGKSVSSCKKNVVIPLMQAIDGIYEVHYKHTDNCMFIGTNRFYIYGGKDEGSQALIQGITLGGILLDEVALMPESFVNQATGRCSVSGSKLWFNCNPENPHHWFKEKWIDKALKRKLLHLHFTMNDNPSLSPAIKERYQNMYDGVFYDRFIRGIWVAAEGAIYSQFAHNQEEFSFDKMSELNTATFISIGIDFGGNKSLTTFVATAIHRNFEKISILEDYHIKGTKGDIDADVVNREFIGFVERLRTKYPHITIKYVWGDSEAQYLINGLYRAIRAKFGSGIQVGDSAKRPIMERIVAANTLLNTGRLKVGKQCKLVADGLCNAVWDPKKPDTRLDNFTSDIDILDAFEYSWERFIPKLTPRVNR